MMNEQKQLEFAIRLANLEYATPEEEIEQINEDFWEEIKNG